MLLRYKHSTKIILALISIVTIPAFSTLFTRTRAGARDEVVFWKGFPVSTTPRDALIDPELTSRPISRAWPPSHSRGSLANVTYDPCYCYSSTLTRLNLLARYMSN
ncbi:hypothetical protein PUN28_002716 [Cardiocondyla obscurior]|uniref:Uncharacterized protein n=1 Tax=Cardiocondyla obscurior TaxID=286306 RepID=A0AAW2GVQ7_9HYME